MFSKPMGTVLLVLGCLTAAAGGAYVATRQNVSDSALTPRTVTATPAKAVAAGRPVAETEAPVSSASPQAEAVPDAPETSAAASHTAAARAEAPVTRRETPPAAAKRVAPAPARTVSNDRPATPVRRTVPMASQTPATPSSSPSTTTAASAPVSQPPAAAAQPAEAITPAEFPRSEPVRVPEYDELILPAASVVGLQMETSLSSERARVEDRVEARVSRDVMASGRVAIPAGSRVIGAVTMVDRGGKLKEQARLGIRFHTLVLAGGDRVPLDTDTVLRLGEAPAASSSKKIGGAAIGGAILGAILGGGKGAAIGGATGAAGGTAAVMAGDRNPATLRQGEYLNVKLAAPVTITVERNQ
jgi:type IV secretory pathway VirB10-like protein